MYLTLKQQGYTRRISTFRQYVTRLKRTVPHKISINRRIIQKVHCENALSNKPLLQKILDIHPLLKELNELVRSFNIYSVSILNLQMNFWTINNVLTSQKNYTIIFPSLAFFNDLLKYLLLRNFSNGFSIKYVINVAKKIEIINGMTRKNSLLILLEFRKFKIT